MTFPVLSGLTIGPDIYELPVPMVNELPALTANQRIHWAEKARRTAMVRSSVAWRARAAKVGRHDRILVRLCFQPQDRRRRDPSNLMPTQKAAVDGLVDAGVVVDDTPRYVVEQMPHIFDPSGGPGGPRRMWLQVVPVLSDEDRAAIAADVHVERTADAADREE